MMWRFSRSGLHISESSFPDIGWKGNRIGLRGRADVIVMRKIAGRAENRTPDLDPAARYLVTQSLTQYFKSINMFVDYTFQVMFPRCVVQNYEYKQYIAKQTKLMILLRCISYTIILIFYITNVH
jgi:hypothetical protein